MSEQEGKGRRAADRRRDKLAELADEGPVERTDQVTPPRKEPTRSAVKAKPGKPAEERSQTGVSRVASVGDAANEVLKPTPLEPTAVRHADEGPPLVGGRLICLEGKDIGKSFDITHEVMLVGRGADAHIKLTDPAVSRGQFEIRYDRQTGQFFFRPLIKDPPPHLNGEEAAGSDRELMDGDVIDVGESTIRFVRVDGPEPKAREAPKVEVPVVPAPPPLNERTFTRLRAVRHRVWASRTVTAVAALVLGVVLVAGFFGVRWGMRTAAEARLNDPQGAYQKLLEHTRTLVEGRRWAELADAARSLQALAPEREDHARLTRAAAEEQLAERNLNLARMNLTAGRFDQARAALKLIPDSSVYKNDRDQMLERTQEHGRASSVAEIKRLMDTGKYQDALQRSDQHLLAYPDDPEVKSLRALATRQAAVRESSGGPAWQAARMRALAALDAGDVGGAAVICDQAAVGADAPLASKMARQLRALQQQWAAAKGFLARKSAKAVKPLVEARELENAIAGGRSAMAKDISRALADALYLGGVDALGAGKECEARSLFERAAQERPGDNKIMDKLSMLASRGRTRLDKAEAARAEGEHAKAVKLAREAVCMLPKGDDARARAERMAAGGR